MDARSSSEDVEAKPTRHGFPWNLVRWWAKHPWTTFWLLPVMWILLLMAAAMLVGEALSPWVRNAIGLGFSGVLAVLWAASFARGLLLTWQTRKPRALIIVGVMVVGVAYVGYSIAPLIRAARIGPDDLVVADPAQAVHDARAMIKEQEKDRERHTGWLKPAELPPSLRVPGLNHATVHADHLDLVLARHPDGYAGGRIWAKVHRPHSDRKTKYPDIYFYRYDNDFPEAPDNIR
jgi:hypothetical protein